MSERNDWQIVENAPPPYAKCAITGFGDGPFVDFGVRLNAIDPNLCINVDVLKDAARFVGMVNPEEHQEAVERVAELEALVNTLQKEAVESQEAIDAIDVLASKGFIARKKPGRKPSAAAA